MGFEHRKIFFAICGSVTIVLFCMLTTFKPIEEPHTRVQIVRPVSLKQYVEPIIPKVPVEMLNILIIVVVEGKTNMEIYRRGLDSLNCYAKIHNYKFQIVNDSQFKTQCPHKDKFFRRHCVVSFYLDEVDYLLFLDADMGVVNPKRRIEEFIDPEHDVILYDRFYNQEIMAGSYLLKNTEYAKKFINGFADYEFKLPKAFHGTDNGAIHAFVAEVIFESREEEFQPCMDIYAKSKDWDNVFTYEACIRLVLGNYEKFGKLKIMRKFTAWARDNWLTNSIWDPSHDFIIHGWKSNQLKKYTKNELPLAPTHSKAADWYDPLVGAFDFDKCVPGNTTWNHDPNLIGTTPQVVTAINDFKQSIYRGYFQRIAKIAPQLGY